MDPHSSHLCCSRVSCLAWPGWGLTGWLRPHPNPHPLLRCCRYCLRIASGEYCSLKLWEPCQRRSNSLLRQRVRSLNRVRFYFFCLQNPSPFTFSPPKQWKGIRLLGQVTGKMKAAFLRFNSSRNNLPLPSSPHLSPTFKAPKCILFLNVKEKKKKKESERKPFCSRMSHSGEGKKGEETSGRIKEMQISPLSLFRSGGCPFAPSSPSPFPPWVALKCQMQQLAADRGVPGGNRLPF